MVKFYQLTPAARLAELKDKAIIDDTDYNTLKTSVSYDQVQICDSMSENVIGGYVLPLSIVLGVPINDKIYSIPMVTEESSVVAAINKTAKMIRRSGTIITKTMENTGIGQIFLSNISSSFLQLIDSNKENWIEYANKNSLLSMKKRGGGMISITAKVLENNTGVINFNINTCDAMGANIINQTLEQIAPVVKKDLKCNPEIKILSNLNDSALTEATLTLDLDIKTAKSVCLAAFFAEQDHYRACTHNKGIMNGIDAVLIATGNDWRAVEAAMHTYANMKPLSSWQIVKGKLVGKLIAPIKIGTVGGIMGVQPIVKANYNILQLSSATELAGVVAAVGLMQNLGALLALTTKGICAGHMRLHIDNIIAEINPKPDHIAPLTEALMQEISLGKPISSRIAELALNKIKAKT